MKPRVVIYYQSPSGLVSIFKKNPDVTDILVASVHFGIHNNQPAIFLNDWDPADKRYDIMWLETKIAHNLDIRVSIMVGGAGGAYTELFKDFVTYYELLKKTIKDRPWITGIDLDIEEGVTLDEVKMLMRQIHGDFGDDFRITFAPVAYALESDSPGMGGFCYKDIYLAPEGKWISWFNVQCYGCFEEDTFKTMLANGYPAEKLVMGMLSENAKPCFDKYLKTLEKLSKNPQFGGTFVWEYFDAPKGDQWAKYVHEAMKHKEKGYFDSWFLF